MAHKDTTGTKAAASMAKILRNLTATKAEQSAVGGPLAHFSRYGKQLTGLARRAHGHLTGGSSRPCIVVCPGLRIDWLFIDGEPVLGHMKGMAQVPRSEAVMGTPARARKRQGPAGGAGSRRTAMRAAEITVLSVLLALLAPLSSVAQAIQSTDPSANWAPPTTVYIPQTGQTLDRLFLDLWREGGGAGAFGYPITPEIEQPSGHIVQYLQYARFEYWPEGDENGNTVTLGTIGKELRPISLPRTVSAFSQRGNHMAESVRIAQAWLPVDAADVPDSPDNRYVDETKHTLFGGFRSWWENNGEAGYLGNPLTEEYILAGVTYQVFERGQLSWTEGDGVLLVPVGQILADKYNLPQEPVPQGDIPTYSEELFVPPPPPEVIQAPDAGPGPVPGVPKSIVVSLSQQTMWAYDSNTVALSSLVSTGKAGFETPTGQFSIVVKTPVDDMEGLIGGEYYDVDEVPDVMYFTGVGHAFHGTYWHNNFGTPMSHGCVNLPLDVAAWLYAWAPMGTPVLIVP